MSIYNLIETKELAYKIICNKYINTSTRLISLCIYSSIRFCEIIDYWLPPSKQNEAENPLNN